MTDTFTPTQDCPPTCGCRATNPTDALAGALFATGRAKNIAAGKESAQAIEWALREYGWKFSPIT